MEDTILKQIGMRIRAYRKAKGFTQEQLAENIDMSSKYFGEVERGEKNSGILNLYKISNGLSLPLQELVDFEKESDSEEERLRVSIKGLLIGKNANDLQKALNILKVLFEK